MAPPTYIISRMGDPIFAVIIGLGAAATRINREQKEKGKTTEQTIEAGKRYISYSMKCSRSNLEYYVDDLAVFLLASRRNNVLRRAYEAVH